MKGLIAFAFVVVVAYAFSPRTEQNEMHRNHKLLEITATNEQQLEVLHFIESHISSADFWLDGGLNKNSVFKIAPEDFTTVMGMLKGAGGKPTILHEDVQEMLNTPEPASQFQAVPFVNTVDHTRYHSYSTIVNYLSQFESKYPNLVKEVGNLSPKTFEGNDIKFITLSNNPNDNSRNAVFIECGIHAREWISPAVCMYFIDQLLEDYTNNQNDATAVLSNYEITIVPVTNPDGYQYTNTNRLWRKNRKRHTHGGCTSTYGVDLNRNFNARWNTTGVSQSCSSETYPGRSVFSEAESQAVRNKVETIQSRLSAYISLHSYSQFILTPFAYDSSKPNEIAHITNIAQQASDIIKAVYGKTFAVGSAGELLNYQASGGSSDWAQLSATKFTVTYELRPSRFESNVGFRLPANQIIPSGIETYPSLVHFILNH